MKEAVADRSKPSSLLIPLILTQITLFLVIIFDIPVARQVLGFLYLTFVPGFTILRLLRLKLEIAESIVFAAGLSLAFLMGVCFLFNFAGPFVGILEPLALLPLMVVTNTLVIVLMICGRYRSEFQQFSASYKGLITFCVVTCGAVGLSIAGTLMVNIPPHTDNSILLLMIILISAVVALMALSKRLVPTEAYPLILFAIALALLFHVSLFSSHIHGGDIFGEYSAFKTTLGSLYWDPTISERLYSMLSITILPTVYSVVLSLEETWILKIVYPLIFALVPVGLYQLFRLKVSRGVAFFSAFFFVSNMVFFTELLELARQMIGELFYVLLFLTIFSNKIKGSAKLLFFTIFGFGLVVSHYALSYIFLAFILAVWLFSSFRKRTKAITLAMVILFAVITFSWYIYVSSSVTFNDLLKMIDHIRENFVSDFLNPQSRGSQVLMGTGFTGLGTFWHLVGRYVYYGTELLVVIGLLSLVLKRRRLFFDDEYNIIALFNMLLVIACIVVPNLADTFNMTRFYHLSLFFLAPFCVLGGISVLKLLSRKKVKKKNLSLVVVLLVLIPFFFFQTGFVYEVTGEESWSLPLSSYRFDKVKLYAGAGVLGEAEVQGGAWLAVYRNTSAIIYTDITSNVVLGYGPRLSLNPYERTQDGSYVYLREYNVLEGIISTTYSLVGAFNTTDISPSLDQINKIYSSGYCDIYKNP